MWDGAGTDLQPILNEYPGWCQRVGICGDGRVNCVDRGNLVGGRVSCFERRLSIGCKPRKLDS
jgi:hypothetical protein